MKERKCRRSANIWRHPGRFLASRLEQAMAHVDGLHWFYPHLDGMRCIYHWYRVDSTRAHLDHRPSGTAEAGVWAREEDSMQSQEEEDSNASSAVKGASGTGLRWAHSRAPLNTHLMLRTQKNWAMFLPLKDAGY